MILRSAIPPTKIDHGGYKAAVDFAAPTARLKAAPFQNRGVNRVFQQPAKVRSHFQRLGGTPEVVPFPKPATAFLCWRPIDGRPLPLRVTLPILRGRPARPGSRGRSFCLPWLRHRWARTGYGDARLDDSRPLRRISPCKYRF